MKSYQQLPAARAAPAVAWWVELLDWMSNPVGLTRAAGSKAPEVAARRPRCSPITSSCGTPS
jgi:hypothetical protein